MERNINKTIEKYIIAFKDDIKKKLFEIDPLIDTYKTNQFLEYVYDYNRLVLTKDDFVKRKRTQIEIPETERCFAARSSGERCTRRKKINSLYCGTHASSSVPTNPKNTDENEEETENEETANDNDNNMEVFTEEIGGILYYIDKYNNVYKTEDILENKKNPEIIAKCIKEENSWKIPQFGI